MVFPGTTTPVTEQFLIAGAYFQIMLRPKMLRLLGLALLTSKASAQATWQSNQVNTTMCYWEQPRAAVLRDTVYIDGGYIWWRPGLSDGTYGAVTSDYNPTGLVYTLNFSKPFNTSQNLTSLFETVSKAGGGGAANNLAPTYYDGAMLANDNEYFLYGGLLRATEAYTPPHSDDVTSYQAFQYGVQKDGFQPGFVNSRLPSGMTRYLAYGGAASAASESKAWYFSGLHSPSWSDIYAPSLNTSLTAVNVSNTLITLDMSTQQQETWRNDTLPSSISGRANPELVWVPIGSQGILVALGGVTYPEFVSSAHVSSNAAASQQESPAFMSTIDVYDVAGGKWYQQSTTGGPGALTRGCAVVAPAQDASSFNIYYYGGYDGLHAAQDFNDDVWVLSLPSFTWTKVAQGTAGHGRAGHKCVTPYPDQMMVIGGYSALTGASPTCVQGGIIQIFNLTSSTWMTSYDPALWGKYGVPDAVRSKIGGNVTGGATATTPASGGWVSPDLQRVFTSAYPASKVTTYYPYSSVGPNNTTNPSHSASSSGTPAFLAPLLGTLIGLMVLVLIVMVFFCLRRRKRRSLKGGAISDAGTESTSTRRRVMAWMRGQPYTPSKEGTVATEGSIMSPEMDSLSRTHSSSSRAMHHEMADTHIAELADTSSRVELGDTSLSPPKPPYAQPRPIFTPSKQSTPGSTGSLNDLHHSNGVSQLDHANSVSGGSSSGGTPPNVHQTLAPATADLEPPPTAHVPGASYNSGVSALSDRDRAHLRTISESTTVSSFGGDHHHSRIEPGNAHVSSDERDVVSPATASADRGYQFQWPTPVSPTSTVGGGGDAMVQRRLTSGSNGTFGESPLRRRVDGEDE